MGAEEVSLELHGRSVVFKETSCRGHTVVTNPGQRHVGELAGVEVWAG